MIEDTQKKTNNENIPKNQIKESIKNKYFYVKKSTCKKYLKKK